MSVHVVTDSVASLPRDLPDDYAIRVVSLFVNDGEHHEADVDIDLDASFRRLADSTHIPTSSQPSVEAFTEAFREISS